MPRSIKPKALQTPSANDYLSYGWKKVHTSAAGTAYTSTLPADIKGRMMEAGKEKRVLSTGTVFQRLLSRGSSNVVAFKETGTEPTARQET